MPGSVQPAVPVGVFPAGLSLAFGHSREYPVVVNEYRNGESQRGVLSSDSRRSWRQTRRLEAAELDQLTAFYLDHKGGTIAFYFYDPWETSPKYSHDPTGAATQGRYTCRFEGQLTAVVGIRLTDASFAIVEVF